MAWSEEQQRNFLGVLGSALKSTPIASKLDVNQTLFKFSNELPRLTATDTVDLKPLFDLLTATSGVSPNEAAAVLLLLQRREDRLGVRFKMPPLVEAMPTQARADLLAALPKTATTGLTAAPVARAPSQPATRPPSQPPAPTPAPAAPAAGGAKVTRQTRLLFGVLLASLAAMGGFYVLEGDSNLKPITPALPQPLLGMKVYEFRDVAFFFDPSKDFLRPKEEMDGLSREALKVALAAGKQEAWLCASEDKSCSKVVRAIARKQGTTYIRPALKDASPPPAPAPVPAPAPAGDAPAPAPSPAP